jgi:hypothetical protein
VRGYLERLVTAGKFAAKLESLCRTEIALNPNWLSPESRRLFDVTISQNEALNQASRHILIAMLEMGADRDSPQTAATIVRFALASGDEKELFKQLKRFGYVKPKRGPGGGYFLTESGMLVAQKLQGIESEKRST